MQTGHSWMTDMSQKTASGKKITELLAIIHAHMDCLLIYLLNGGEICAVKWCAFKTPSCKSAQIYIIHCNSNE